MLSKKIAVVQTTNIKPGKQKRKGPHVDDYFPI